MDISCGILAVFLHLLSNCQFPFVSSHFLQAVKKKECPVSLVFYLDLLYLTVVTTATAVSTHGNGQQ